MKRKSQDQILTMQCLMCGLVRSQTIIAATHNGWRWFKGFLPNRQDICPDCMVHKPHEFDYLRELSLQRTAN